METKFFVIDSSEVPSNPNYSEDFIYVYLVKDSWNDWWQYQTVFDVQCQIKNSLETLGTIKIGQKGLVYEKEELSPAVPPYFDQIPPDFFSVGQDVTYYSTLYNLGDEIRYHILKGLNDIAQDEKLYEEVKNEHITRRSLLRSISSTSVKGQFRRLANGNAKLTEYFFSYKLPNNETSSSFEVEVQPNSRPPSNLHVIIGRNGVGKTRLLKNLINNLRTNRSEYGEIIKNINESNQEDLFANLVSVSFSSFDPGTDELMELESEDLIRYYNIGLLKKEKINEKDEVQKQEVDEELIEKTVYTPKTLIDLQNEFKDSLLFLSNSSKTKRWKKAIKTLESDPIFNGLGIEHLIKPKYKDRIDKIFNKLSSGHKIVLLTITKLVETVEERSLVILDEPEIHLHPPLLSAFTRALSDLLIYRNAVALIATHSPVIVQEVPKNCVWIMNRTNDLVSFERPEIETFGENIGTLTREIFGLEVTNSGFHSLLRDIVGQSNDYDEVVSQFDERLGLEAKTIIRSLFFKKDGR
ncbi:AAA family ATPase [Gracilibacillus sp. S3-1-1]|uniref:AAA family ATPase n=1 Tax=Gracilibacillus pellucidus TaxID=3095368 RepID=A0ACC6M6Z8_9BACI|nr:AAA family ATPase [Gracilibacillus sp. S3-1-1]MDX8046622.1 AAA family ATPase [Gracilibacillus sp. S3-1-1]